MEEKSGWQQRKEILTMLAGHWYAASIDQNLVFSFCEKLSGEAPLNITNKGIRPVETVYSLGSYLGEDMEAQFFIDIGLLWASEQWYKIKELTATKMLLVEIEKAAGR